MASSCNVPPTSTVPGSGVSSSDAKSCATVTLWVAVTVPDRAVITLAPLPTAVRVILDPDVALRFTTPAGLAVQVTAAEGSTV